VEASAIGDATISRTAAAAVCSALLTFQSMAVHDFLMTTIRSIAFGGLVHDPVDGLSMAADVAATTTTTDAPLESHICYPH